MAHSRSKVRSHSSRLQTRVKFHNANQRLRSALHTPVSSVFDLREVEDRRRYSPERPRVPLTRRGTQARTILKNVNKPLPGFVPVFDFPEPVAAFESPSETLVCVRRQQRKEVMFAKRKAGKRGQKRPRFNQFSKIHCKR